MSKNSSCKTEKTYRGHAPGIVAQMRENGKRRLWLFALLSFVMLIAYPLIVALTLNRYADGTALSALIRQGVGHDVLGMSGGTVFLATVGGVVCAMEGFSWIYSPRKIDMYLSQPITAGRRFFMTYINGVLLYFIPYLASLLLALLVLSGAGAVTASLLVNILFTVVFTLVYFLAVYGLTLFMMMLGGKRGMAGFFVLLGLFYDAICRAVFEYYCSTYFATYAGRAGDRQFLSPLCRMFVLLNECPFYTGREAVQVADVVEGLIKPMLSGGLVLLFEAAAFSLAAYLCYKRRPMETFSRAVAFPALRGPVKVFLMVPAGLLGSGMFSSVSGNNGFFVAFSGLLLGILFCQALLEIVYAGDLKAFHRHKRSFALGAAATVLLYLFFALDLSGYDTWVPKEKDVESAAIEIAFDNRYNFSYVDEKGERTWSEQYGLDTMEVTDVSGILSLAADGMGKDAGEQNEDTKLRCEVKYKMKNGKERYRSFFIDYEKEKTVLNILFANEEYKRGTNQVLSGEMDWIFERSMAYYDNGMQEREVADKNALALMRAYQKDVREMSFTDIKDAVPCGTLRLRYRTDGMNEYDLVYPVFPSYTGTVEYLRGKSMELYLNINPRAVESIQVRRYDENEKIPGVGDTIFGTEEIAVRAGAVQEYTKKEQISELLGAIYPSTLASWVYVADILDDDIGVMIRDADTDEALYYNWNDDYFRVRKGELPEFVEKDLGGE